MKTLFAVSVNMGPFLEAQSLICYSFSDQSCLFFTNVASPNFEKNVFLMFNTAIYGNMLPLLPLCKRVQLG